MCCVFAIIFFLLPLGVILFDYFGYTFELASYSVFTVIAAVVAVSIVVFCTAAENPAGDELATVLFVLAPPLLLLVAVFYILACSSIWVGASMFICVCCCCYLTVRYVEALVFKIVSFLLTAFMALPIGFFILFVLIFGNIGQDTIVQSVESPDGTYYAEVIDNDQGALGGSTFVDLYENKGINAFVFRIFKTPQRIYYGRWGEFENMEIYWKDENCLVINSAEYAIR